MAQSPAGTKLKARIEDEYPSTEPFEETAVLESPSAETQLVDWNGDTEVLDIPDFADSLRAHIVDDSEKEVVLDSDDEEIQRNEVLTGVKGLLCDGPDSTSGQKSGETPNKDKKQLDVTNNHCNLGFLMRRGSTVAESKSVEANCLAKSSLTGMGSSHGDQSDRVDLQYEELPVMKSGISRLQNQKTIDTNVDAVSLDHRSYVPEPARLSDIESQEPGESSQAALDFVDHYLSVNDVNLPQEVENGNPNKLTSPPALSAKGSRNLAMGASLRTKAWDSRTFDWDENQPELILGWQSHRARSVATPQLANSLKFQKERKVGEKCKDINLNLVDSRLIVHKSNQISEVRKAAGTASSMLSSKELDKQFDAEPLEQQPETNSSEWDVPDMDVGFDTQMAAEAIEALLYAPPPSHDANTDQGLENMLENTSKCATVKKVTMGCSFLENGSSGSVGTTRFYKRTKRSANRLSRNKSTSNQNDSKNQVELDPNVEVTKEVQRRKSSTDMCTRDVNPQSRESKTSSKVVTRKEEEKKSEKENIRCIRNLRSSKAVSCDLLVEIEEKVSSSPPVARRTGRRSSLVSSMMTTDTKCDHGGKRMRNGLDTDKLLGERKKPSKLGFDSVEATNCEANHKKETSQDIATSTSSLKSNPWIFPKRKRTCQYVSHLSESPSTVALSNVLDDENCNRSDDECQIKSEELRTPCLTSIVKRKVRSAQSFRHSSEEMCVDNTVTGKFSEESFESVVITGQMAHVNSAKFMAYGKSSKLDKVDPTSFAGGKENKENELSNVNIKASTTIPTSGKDFKQQYKRRSSTSPLLNEIVRFGFSESQPDSVSKDLRRNVKASTTIPASGEVFKQQYKRKSSRSPLLKELARLGIAESLPDFVSKDLRRRWNKSNIRVLFSQSLDDRIIKKQKKILVRLGISVASDCSDATHFVTDRFVRTRNMLEAMALGKPVVTHLWLENCLEAKCFLDEKKYILHDFKREKELGFSMLASLVLAKEHPLLKDQRVIVTRNVKPSREMIESLVEKVHGQVVKGSQKTARKDKVISNDLLILSCEEDYVACVPFLEEGAAVYSSELLLSGIVIQKLEYERHRLFKDHVQTNSPTIRQRKRRKQHVPAAIYA